MEKSSSQNPSLPKITPKEEPITLDKPEIPNPFLPTSQVNFTFDEITFSTNNEVALLYPSHPNQDYFEAVSDFISKCCLKEAFTRVPNQYKEYLSEVWFLSLLLEHMMPEYENKELTINSTQVFSVHNLTLKPNEPKEPPFTDYVKAICNLDGFVDSKAPKPSSQTEEIPNWPIKKETKSSSAKDKSLIHPSPPTLVVGEMHKEGQQAAGGPTSLGVTSKEGAHPQLSSGFNPSVLVDKTKFAGDELKTAHTDSGANEESRADDISLKVKLEDLSDILKDTRSAFFTPDSPPDEPIIFLNESEEEEVAKDKDT
ncbi:hypothetical protein Tco_0795077 [Tanacetum coccineum]